MKPTTQTFGSLSANFNESTWSCSQIAVSVTEIVDRIWLQIHVQNEKVEYVIINVSPFNGQGTYFFGENTSIRITNQGIRYFENTRLVKEQIGSIKITNYIAKSDSNIHGKIAGEFKGTLKDTKGNSLIITNGKFNSIII